MDLQKHGFWVALGVVLVLELGFLFLFVLPADGKVTKAEQAISRHMKQLQKLASQGEIPNPGNITQSSKARADAARGLLRSVLHLVATDQLLLEGRVPGIDTPEDIAPHFKDKQRQLKQQLVDGKGAYSGLRLLGKDDGSNGQAEPNLVWPDHPVDPDDVADFYRKWWVIKMMIDRVLAPVSKLAVAASPDKKPWELYEISWGDDLEGEKGGYVNQYLRIRAVLNIRLTDLHKLFQGLVNTPFLVLPVRLLVKQAKPDPREIRIRVPYGQKEPNKKELQRLASLQRPLVEVELVAKVADLDRKKLLDVGRRFRKYLGHKKALETYIEDLKEDKDFLKGFSDKDKFLDTMKVELMKKP